MHAKLSMLNFKGDVGDTSPFYKSQILNLPVSQKLTTKIYY